MKRWLLLLLLTLPAFVYAQQGVPEYNVNCALSTQLNTDGLVCIQTATTPPDARGPTGQSRVQGHTYLWSLNTSLFTDITAGGGAGTITGVTAGGGLAGGGTVGTVTLSMAPFTNHSLLAGSGVNTPSLIAPGTNGWCLISNGTVANPSFQACPGAGGGGSVTSVGLTMPSGFTVTNSPITTAGTIGVTTTLNGMLKGTGSAFTTGSAGTDYVAPGLATSSGLTVSAASLLGRSSAGALQEITMGSGMTLSGTTLSSAVTTSGNYAWTGTNSWLDGSWSLLNTTTPSKILKFDLSGFTASTTRTIVLPNASTRLLGDSDFSNTGGMYRTAANTYVARTLQGTTGNITVTNGDGIAGPPTFDLGATAVQTDISNTYTTGDQNMSNALSLTVPIATGAAPTANGRIAYDLTSNHFKGGYFNGSTQVTGTFAFSSEVQPLNTNLTALSSFVAAAHGVPIFTSSTTMKNAVLPNCIDSAGQHINYDISTDTWSCGTSSTGGLSGMTTGKLQKATTASTIGDSVASESGGNITIAGGLLVGASGPYLINDTSAIASTDKTITYQNVSGYFLPGPTSLAGFTNGHVVTANVTGGIVTLQDGGAAGSGTWTDSSTNTGSSKTLVATGAGGTNTLTLPIIAVWDGGSMTPDGTLCTDPTRQTINSGPTGYFFSCASNNSSTFDGSVTLSHSVTTVTFTLTVNDTVSSSHVFRGEFKAQCHNNNTAVNSTWGTGVTATATMVTANNNYTATTANVTPSGTCSAGATLFWRFTKNTATDTDAGTARVINVTMQQTS